MCCVFQIKDLPPIPQTRLVIGIRCQINGSGSIVEKYIPLMDLVRGSKINRVLHKDQRLMEKIVP